MGEVESDPTARGLGQRVPFLRAKGMLAQQAKE